MKLTFKSAFALTALSLFTPCVVIRAQVAVPAAQASDKGRDLIQGIWVGVEVGREAEGKCTLTVTGDAIEFRGANKNEWYKATFTLPAETDPKQLRAVITECPAPDFIGKPSLAIYKVQDGTLTLVGHPPGAASAPKGFEGDAKSRTFVFQKAPK